MKETDRQMQFLSHVDNGEGKHFQLVSTIEFKRHDPTTLAIEVLLLGDEAERKAASFYLTRPPFYDQIWLHSDEPRTASVEVLGMRIPGHREHRFRTNVSSDSGRT